MGNRICERRAVEDEEEADFIELNRFSTARLRWRRAIRLVIDCLRKRYTWHKLGKILEEDWIQTLILGIKRVEGKVRRVQKIYDHSLPTYQRVSGPLTVIYYKRR